MKVLSPTMLGAIRNLDVYFETHPERPLQLGGYWGSPTASTIRALARRGCCKITRVSDYVGDYPYADATGEFVSVENWHPDILHRLASL